MVFLVLACCAPLADSAPAISISDFGAEPDDVEVDSQGIPADVVLRLVLSNSGNASGTVNVIIALEPAILLTKNVTVGPNSTQTVNLTWQVRAAGRYNLTAAISGDGAVQPQTCVTGVTASYVPVRDPSPWYTIPCALLVIIVPACAIVVAIRWLGRGGDGKTDEKRQ